MASVTGPSHVSEAVPGTWPASVQRRRSAQPASVRCERAALEPPRPVAVGLARAVHARLAAEPEHVLRRDDRERGAASRSASSISPQCGSRGSRPVASLCACASATRTSRRRVGVVRARVDDLSRAGGCAARAGSPREPPNAHCSTTMPGKPSSSRSAVHGRRDHAEVLGDQRQLAERPLDRVEELGARGRAATCRCAPSCGARGSPSTRRSRGSGRCARRRRARSARRKRSIHQR